MKKRLLRTACAATWIAGMAAVALPALSQDSQSVQDKASQAESTTATDGADDQAAPGSTVVVVTSTRRKERLQDVPISITTFSQKELTAKGIVGFEGLARETPGVILNKAGANFNYFTARGVATNSGYGAGLQATVAVYVDEQPINANGNTTNIDPNLFDVDHIEFLRGPQGTLFGSGSLAGALRIIQRAPDPTGYSSAILADVGVTGKDSVRQRYNFMVNVPIVRDELALRVVGFYRNEAGYINNIGTGIKHANSLLDAGGRVSLLWKPSDRLSVKLVGSSESSYPKDSAMTSPNLGNYTKISDQPDLFTGKFNSFNATIDYQFDWAHFMSSTTYSTFDQQFIVDLAGTFNSAIPFGLDAYAYRRSVVQEARLVSNPGGKLDWAVGGFYLDRRQYLDYELRSKQAFLTAHNITGLSGEHYLIDYTHVDSNETAIYGDMTYHFSDKFWTTAGLRYGGVSAQGFEDGNGFSGTNYYTLALTVAAYEAAGYDLVFPGNTGALTRVASTPAEGVKAKGTKPSYRFSVSYKPLSSLTTYATISTGFRTPVINALAGSVSLVDPNDLIIPDGAKSDDITNYELGAKGRWFGGKLAGSVALYQIDWNNIQVQANRVSDGVQFATNIGGATSKGVEWELQSYPAKGLTLGLSGSFNESKVTKLSASEASISGAVMGARLSAPHFSGTAYFNYAFNLTPNAKANWSLVVSHVDSYPNAFPNTPGKPAVPLPTYDYTDAYDLVNTTFAVALKDYTIGLYIENLTDSHAVAYVHPETFMVSRYARLTPRTIGLRLTADF